MAERVGQQLGNYQLIHLLGEGGFAEVYLGEHIYLGTQAAIKVLHTQLTSDDIYKFRTEARTIAHLIHPHIVRVLEFGVEGKTPFLVMDYAPNGTLRQRHPKGTRLPLDTIVSYVKQVADALQYAHDEKLIHRDIKPENMLLGRRNEILLSDFGIALVAQSSRYQSAQEMAGTMAYMAPEQIQGKPRPASDQYSLGIVVYEWLCGDRPFHGSLTELVGQHLSVPPPSLQEKLFTISPEVEQVVLTALAKDPKRRFASVQTFAIALEQASQSSQHYSSASPVAASPSSQSPRPNVIAPSPGQSSLLAKGVEAISLDPLPSPTNTVIPLSHSPQSTNVIIPPNQPLDPTNAVTPSAPLSQPTFVAIPTRTPAVSPPSTEEPVLSSGPQLTKRRISRRTALVGLAGLAVAGGGITWLARSQRPQAFSPSASPTTVSTPTSTPSPTPSPSPTPTLVPVGTTLFIYRGHSDRVNAVAWSPHGKYIASAAGSPPSVGASKDNTVQVWDPTTGNLVYVYHGHSAAVESVAWSPDGKRIASGSDDKTVQIWDATTGRNVLIYKGHSNDQDGVWALAWSHDGTRIASASPQPFSSPYSPSTGGTVQIWDAMTGRNAFIYMSGGAPIAWSPDGKAIVSASSLNIASEQVWVATSGNPLVTYNNHSIASNTPAFPVDVAWSHDGTRIATGVNGGFVEVWSATSGRHLITYNYNKNRGIVHAVRWSPNDKSIASGDNLATAQVWDVATGNHIYTYSGHSSTVAALGWSLDGKRIVSGSWDTTVQVWQAV